MDTHPAFTSFRPFARKNTEDVGVTASDCQRARAESGGCYAIFWGYDAEKGVLCPKCHWDTPDSIEATKASTGSDQLFTTETRKVQFEPGQGFVGRCYKDGDSMFLKDVSQVPDSEFSRKELAARFGIVSVALKPFADGVMEVGSAKKWDASHWIHTVTQADCERAAQDAQAQFAVFWGYDIEKGVLRPAIHWNTEEHVAEAKKRTGGDETYAEASYGTEVAPGSRVIGMAFWNQKPSVHQDVSELTFAEFKRKAIVDKFGIKGSAFKPYRDGVMEVGATTRWESCSWASTLSTHDCKWAAKEAGADFAIYWSFDQAKGVLRPTCHWNPPDHVAAVKAATGNSELYTTESYQGELKPGDGFVGKAYKEAHAMFIPDLSVALDSEYSRKQLATKYGVVSLALKPMGDGVMEIGTSNRWDSCEWVRDVTPKDCQRAAEEAEASFAIYWGFDVEKGVLRPMCHWDPPKRIAELKEKTGGDETYATESYRFPRQPGDGYVGKSFGNQETMFFPDMSKVPQSEFKRRDLEHRFGIVSMAFKPFANGVMEVGCTKKWEECDWVNRVTVEDCQRVAREAGADFCIYWKLDSKGMLHPSSHWEPPERIAVTRASTGKDELYTTESYKTELGQGLGYVGKAFVGKETRFIQDVTAESVPASEYPRKALAAKFGVVSLGLKPFGDGVYEVGWTTKREGCDWLNTMTADDCRRVCLDVKGDYAICWVLDQAKGVIRAASHWNPPERIAEAKAEESLDDDHSFDHQAQTAGDLYTTESYRFQFKAGVGSVGRCFQEKKVISIPDVAEVSAVDYSRKGLAARFGMKTIVFLPAAGGVLEVGAAQAMDASSFSAMRTA